MPVRSRPVANSPKWRTPLGFAAGPVPGTRWTCRPSGWLLGPTPPPRAWTAATTPAIPPSGGRPLSGSGRIGRAGPTQGDQRPRRVTLERIRPATQGDLLAPEPLTQAVSTPCPQGLGHPRRGRTAGGIRRHAPSMRGHPSTSGGPVAPRRPATGAVPATPAGRVLVADRVTTLLDDLLRLTAAAGVEVDVVPDASAARRAWSAAAGVLVGDDLARPSLLRPPARRDGVVLVGVDQDDAGVWRRGLDARRRARRVPARRRVVADRVAGRPRRRTRRSWASRGRDRRRGRRWAGRCRGVHAVGGPGSGAARPAHR